MKKAIEELLTTLDHETACYGELEKVLTDEKEAISLSKKEGFERLQSIKEALVQKLQRYEKKREPLVDQLADAHGQKDRSLTVGQLASLISSPDDIALINRANRLRSIIAVVKEKNKQNQLLINQYLDLIKTSLKLLTHHLGNNSVYQKAGTFEPFSGYRSGGGRIISGAV